MRVLVTGHRGFIGCHVIELLREAGHTPIGCDSGLFDGCHWLPLPAAEVEWERDFRELEARDLGCIDVIIHLAAISNDPMGELNPELTASINGQGAIRLAQRAKEAGVSCFLFAGSCSVYGKNDEIPIDETADLKPMSSYAKAKVEAEQAILAMADPNFCPVSLRCATAFGSSPMLRVDLVANDLLAAAYSTGLVPMLSDGSPWRPLIHCRDIARTFLALAEADEDRIRGQAINIGANNANYQVRDIAQAVKELIPHAEVRFAEGAGPDPRSYQVNFDLLGELLPHFRMEYDLYTGLEELLDDFLEHGFDAEDYYGRRFVRLRWLQRRHAELVDQEVPHAL